MGKSLRTVGYFVYSSVLYSTDHGDSLVTKAQKWIEEHYTESIDYDRLAGKFRMSRRSLERRFKQATGTTPLGYLQQLRVENAKRLLEDGSQTFDEITYQVGYEDIPFFRKEGIKKKLVRISVPQQPIIDRRTGYSLGRHGRELVESKR